MAARRPVKTVFSTRIPLAQRIALEEVAVREGLAASEIVRMIIRRVASEGSIAFLFDGTTPRPTPAE